MSDAIPIDKIELVVHPAFGLLKNRRTKPAETYYETAREYNRGYPVDPEKFSTAICKAISKDLSSKYENEKTLFVYIMNEDRIEKQDNLLQEICKKVPKNRLVVLSGDSPLDLNSRVIGEAISRKKISLNEKKLRVEAHGETIWSCVPDMLGNLVRALEIPALTEEFKKREPKLVFNKEKGSMSERPFLVYVNLFGDGRRLEINPKTTDILWKVPRHKLAKRRSIKRRTQKNEVKVVARRQKK
ncbi:MAG: hypothetical protein ABID38_04405 [Candidatus Diapherotrites archaeon]